MKKELPFKIPFSGFAAMTFLNCFASVYLFLENITGDSEYKYACRTKEGQPCDGCGNCRDTPAGVQEKHFFLFDTVCGHSALRCRFDGERTSMEKEICETDFYDGGTEYTVDFLFGFAGYAYKSGRTAPDLGPQLPRRSTREGL